MATVTLGRAGGSVLWHPAFLEFARHYGYIPRVCRPRHPNRLCLLRAYVYFPLAGTS
jgi:transposase